MTALLVVATVGDRADNPATVVKVEKRCKRQQILLLKE
jgi:hypothetical protein